jgi:DNA-binding winged helix-turn-helix (wHTH) protein/TolB-like protein
VRKTGRGEVDLAVSSGSGSFTFGDWLVDPAQNRVSRPGEAHHLEARTMDVLVYLLERPEQVVSSESLLDELWPGRLVEQSSVHRRINQIRQVLGDEARDPRYIRTIVKRGYQTIAPVANAEGGAGDGSVGDESHHRAATRSTRLRQFGLWIAGVAILISGVAVLWRSDWPASEPVPSSAPKDAHGNPVIAVLPFRSPPADGDANSEANALAAGITNEVAGVLGRQGSLDLVANYSAARFRERTADIRDARDLLGADYVLDGSVRIDGDDGRVDVELIDTSDGTSLLNRQVPFVLTELRSYFELYDEIARATALQLQLAVDSDWLGLELRSPPTDSLEAYQHWREALVALREYRLKEGLAEADRAIGIDAGFGRAYVLRGAILIQLAETGLAPACEGYAGARVAVDRALSREPELGFAYVQHAALAMRLDLDFAEAWRALDRTDEQGALKWLSSLYRGELLLNSGRYEEALSYYRLAARMDPLENQWHGGVARVLDRMGRREEARGIFERLVATRAQFWNVAYFFEHLLPYDVDRAEGLLDSLDPNIVGPYWRPVIAHARGDPAPLRSAVERWIANRAESYVPADLIAWAWFRLGDYPRYLQWFDRQVEECRSLHYLHDNLFGRDLSHVAPADYWGTLEGWALGDAEREVRLARHRTRVRDLMAKMVLPE